MFRPTSPQFIGLTQLSMPTSTVRRFGSRLLPLILGLFVLAACQPVTSTAFGRSIDDLLVSGESYARHLVERRAGPLTDEEVVVIGYLERARVGLGSPFRLIAFANRDPRLSDPVRQKLSYALLGATLQGRGYQADPAVLEVLQLMGGAGSSGVGLHHLRLIERTITDAPSASSGERAVRLGYMLAGVERSINGSPDPVVGYVAAMVADRRRAREDAQRLLAAAARQNADPLVLLDDWRRDLRLQVERPALFRGTPGEEIAETYRGTQVAASLRTLSQRLSAGVAAAPGGWRGRSWSRSLLSESTAQRLLALADSLHYPAQAPIAVAVSINRDALVGRPGLDEIQKRRRSEFVARAINEESLIASAAALAVGDGPRGPRLSLILLQSGVFMRGWNQEEPWFPGDPAPTARELESRFGLASVSVDADVPEAWRPFYRLMLGRALTDLQRVLPTASVRGLNVRFGETPQGQAALAIHDPRSRTLVLPPGSGAGTIAHEIAHDLDWQLARKRYGRRGSYATDLAVQRRAGDRLATSLAGLTASFAREGPDPESSAHDRRPAEVFARGMDWLVAVHLAAEGRTGGYLTSFQDAAIAGYGSTRTPQVDGSAVPALLTILDQIAPVTAETRQRVSENHGPSRTLTSKELVRAIIVSARDGGPFDRFDGLQAARDRALQGLSAASCRMTPSPDARRVVEMRRELIRSTVAAVSRGIVIDGVRSVAELLPEPVADADLNEFLMWRLDGGPEPADPGVLLLQPAADALLLRAASLATEDPSPTGGFRVDAERTLCGGNPFAAESRTLLGRPAPVRPVPLASPAR